MLPLILATVVAAPEPVQTGPVVPPRGASADHAQHPPRPAPSLTGGQSVPGTPHLLGDWGGVRTAMEAKGFTPSIDYIAMPATNIVGGERQRIEYAAQLNVGLRADLGRVMGLDGGTVQLLLIDRHGRNLTETAGLQVLQNPQAIFGAGRIWRLSQFFYRQRVGNIEGKIGRMSVGEDFASAPCFFQSLYFCGPVPGHVAPAYWYNPPVSVWGARVRVEDRLGYTQFGAYERNPVNRQIDHGFYLGTRGATGVLLPVERGFTTRLGGDRGRTGTYKIGAWYDTSRSASLLRDADGGFASLTGRPLATARGRWGAYATARQQVTAAAKDGSGALNLFMSGVLTDARTNPIRSKVIGGVTWSGLVAGRPKDEIGIAIGRTSVNPGTTELGELLRDRGSSDRAPQRAEWVVELTYSVVVHPALSLRPNLQLYRHPGGRSDRSAIAIIGMGAFATF